MKKLTPAFAATMLFTALMMLSGLSVAVQAATYRGEIMDSHCAVMGHHPIADAKQCTLDCVKMGAKFVLYNAATKATYQLDDQQKPMEFAGQKVVINGTLDKATKTIHVTGIKGA